jgi:1,4-dihydroxy-2-naphthoyl-CoA hydrolase
MFEYRFELGMSSTDPAGVLFYPALFRHAHDAYEALMRDSGLALDTILGEGGYALPIAHAEADYRRPLRHGESVEVAVVITRLGESAFTVEFDFRNSAGESCATARSVHVLLDLATGTPISLPEPWRARLQKHLPAQT